MTIRKQPFTRRWTPFVLLTMFLSLGIIPPSLAQPADDSEQGSVSEAAAEDAVFDAQTSGQTEEGILEDIEYQDRVNEIVDPIILKHEDIFSEAGFSNDRTAYVVFTEPIPEQDAAVILGIEGVTLSEDGVYTADEADELMEDVSERVEDGLSEDASFMVQMSPVTGEVTIASSEAVNSDTQVEVQEIIEEAQSSTLATNSDGSTEPNSIPTDALVTFDIDETLEADEQAVNGGDKLTLRNTKTHSCTAAFPAKSDGYAGLLTAGHCPNGLTVDYGNRLYSATKEKRYSNGDMQWHRSRETVNGRFRYKWGTYRAVTAHPVLKVGTKVCRFGATSGNGSGCTTVVYVSACITYDNDDGGKYCNLAMTQGHTGSQSGDSGGPWFYGNSAYGIHSGSGSRDGAYRNWFYPSRKAVTADGMSPIYDDDGAIR